jgi:hypothetical protein
VKRRSPTSVWRHSMFSTRKARMRPAKACRLPGVADVVAAAVVAAVVAPVAVLAAAAAVDAGLSGERAAARRGARAAGASPDLLSKLIDAIVMAGFDKIDPANAFFLAVPSTARVGQFIHDGRADFRTFPEVAVRRPEKGVSVVRENVVHRQAGVASKLGVPKP